MYLSMSYSVVRSTDVSKTGFPLECTPGILAPLKSRELLRRLVAFGRLKQATHRHANYVVDGFSPLTTSVHQQLRLTAIRRLRISPLASSWSGPFSPVTDSTPTWCGGGGGITRNGWLQKPCENSISMSLESTYFDPSSF